MRLVAAQYVITAQTSIAHRSIIPTQPLSTSLSFLSFSLLLCPLSLPLYHAEIAQEKVASIVLQPKMFYVQRVSSTLLWDFGAKAERARTIAALRLARHEGQDGRFMGHAPYVAHGPRNALRTGSLIGRHLYLCTMTVVVT